VLSKDRSTKWPQRNWDYVITFLCVESETYAEHWTSTQSKPLPRSLRLASKLHVIKRKCFRQTRRDLHKKYGRLCPWQSCVQHAVVYRDRPRAWLSGVRIPAGAITFSSKLPDLLWGSHSLLLNGYRGSFSGGKVAAAWSWSHVSLQCWGEERVELHLYSPYMPSRHREGQLFPISTMLEGQNTCYEFNSSVQEVYYYYYYYYYYESVRPSLSHIRSCVRSAATSYTLHFSHTVCLCVSLASYLQTALISPAPLTNRF